MARKTLRHEIVDSMREIIFGLEDSLVSTLGAITGIAVGTQSRNIVILSGLVLLAAEAMSMAAGSYLSSKHAYEAAELVHNGADAAREAPQPLRAAFVMGVCYIAGGIVPLIPYVVLPVDSAVVPAIALTAVTLFFVGYWAASYTKTSNWKSGLEMTIVSLAAALVGYLIARGAHALFGIDRIS